jgi:hypothetical protein
MSVRPAHTTPGIYRAPAAREWQPVEIIAAYPNERFLCREVGRPLPGVFMASRSDLRVDAGVSFRVVK